VVPTSFSSCLRRWEPGVTNSAPVALVGPRMRRGGGDVEGKPGYYLYGAHH